jgi:hypothetical protein
MKDCGGLTPKKQQDPFADMIEAKIPKLSINNDNVADVKEEAKEPEQPFETNAPGQPVESEQPEDPVGS